MRGRVLRFGEFRLDAARRTLSRAPGGDVRMPHAALDVLIALVGRPGEIISKSELMAAVWPNVTVTENSLNQAITSLRRALDDGRTSPRYVATIPGRGYRFVAPVVAEDDTARDPAAYQHYAVGLSKLARPTRRSLVEAHRHFEEALAIDPEFALAWVAVAEYFHMMSAHGFMPGPEPLLRGHAAAKRALELDPDLVDAQVVDARMREIAGGDRRTAEAFYRTIIAQHPRCYTAHRYLGLGLIHAGRVGEAISLLAKAQAIEPLATIVSAEVGMALYFAGRYTEAIAQLELALGMDPGFELTHAFLGRSLVELGRFDEAIAAFEKAPTSGYGAPSGVPIALALSGRAYEARAMLRALLGANPPARSYDVAQILAALGEDADALVWLERAGQDRMAAFFAMNPVFSRLRHTRRFRGMIERFSASD